VTTCTECRLRDGDCRADESNTGRNACFAISAVDRCNGPFTGATTGAEWNTITVLWNSARFHDLAGPCHR